MAKKEKGGRPPSSPREKTRQMAIRIGPEFDIMFELLDEGFRKAWRAKFSKAEMAKMMMRAGFVVYAEEIGVDLDKVEALVTQRYGEADK